MYLKMSDGKGSFYLRLAHQCDVTSHFYGPRPLDLKKARNLAHASTTCPIIETCLF